MLRRRHWNDRMPRSVTHESARRRSNPTSEHEHLIALPACIRGCQGVKRDVSRTSRHGMVVMVTTVLTVGDGYDGSAKPPVVRAPPTVGIMPALTRSVATAVARVRP